VYGPLASILKGFDLNTFYYQTDLSKAKALWRQAGEAPGTALPYRYATG
jgi:hypothetical protein